MSGLSIRAYAKHRKDAKLSGGTLAAVQNAITDGRITRNAAGKIDAEKADAEWEANTRPERRPPGTRGPSIGDSRAVREAFLAQSARLDYYERVGRLVAAEDVEREFFAIARTMRERLLSIPIRLAADVAATNDIAACEKLIDDEIRAALEVLAR